MSSLTDLYETLKQIAVRAVEASDPVKIMTGVVTSESPLTITTDQRLPLTREFLVVADKAKQKLQQGNTLILIRKQGGQKYFVIDRVGDGV